MIVRQYNSNLFWWTVDNNVELIKAMTLILERERAPNVPYIGVLGGHLSQSYIGSQWGSTHSHHVTHH